MVKFYGCLTTQSEILVKLTVSQSINASTVVLELAAIYKDSAIEDSFFKYYSVSQGYFYD